MGNFCREGTNFDGFSEGDYNGIMNKYLKIRSLQWPTNILLIGLFWLGLASCNKTEGPSNASKSPQKGSSPWQKGDCIDTHLSPYILQIVQVDGEKVLLYKMGEMGKEVFTRTYQELTAGEAPFKKVPCP